MIQPADGLVATWENLHPSPQSAVDNMFGRQAQASKLGPLLPWVTVPSLMPSRCA